MQELQEGTKITAITNVGTVDTGIIIEKADSETSRSVYLVRWLNDGTQTLFEVKEENLPQEKKREKKKKNTRRKSKRQSR